MDFWGIAPDGDSDPDTTFSESGRFDFAAAENTIINVCQLVDGFKGFAETDGDWSEWDQATYNALQSLLVSVSKQNSSGQQP